MFVLYVFNGAKTTFVIYMYIPYIHVYTMYMFQDYVLPKCSEFKAVKCYGIGFEVIWYSGIGR